VHNDGGKGMRVTGFFLFLLGTGVMLDSAADVAGAVVAAAGAVILVVGLSKVQTQRSTLAAGGDGRRR
jgi:hypothetical protein